LLISKAQSYRLLKLTIHSNQNNKRNIYMGHTAIKDKTKNQWIIIDCKGNPMETLPTFESVVDALRYINEHFSAKAKTSKTAL